MSMLDSLAMMKKPKAPKGEPIDTSGDQGLKDAHWMIQLKTWRLFKIKVLTDVGPRRESEVIQFLMDQYVKGKVVYDNPK
jgi:hypothetical protein